MKKIILTLLFLPFFLSAQTYRDSLDVVHYTINLFISPELKKIEGWTEISVKPLFDEMHTLSFDLLSLNVRKVVVNQKKWKHWKQNDTCIRINLKKPLKKDEVQTVRIYYSGKPAEDDFWGGFYFKYRSAFNLGVGMDAIPHPFGRAWFPCIDNFTDRATYDFYITVDKKYTAVCNGLLVETKQKKNLKTFHWRLNRTIPTYLASVSVAEYDSLTYTYKGMKGEIPVKIFVFKGKKSLAKETFKHLDTALRIFEKLYGPYEWERVGYSEINFGSGAMEHAENISVTYQAINGNTKHETLLYHELSHHWFGDLVTCKTARDMWLNEGWAEYSEAIFLENLYGKAEFKKAVRRNHFYALNYAHKNDRGYRSVANMDLHYTYGTTIYKKGADVVHTLRFYLGDSVFFPAVRAYLEKYKFSSASTEDLKNFFTTYSGENLTDFFDFWLYSKGYPYFELTGWKVVDSNKNSFKVQLTVNQQVIGGDKLANSNKIPLTFFSNDFRRFDTIVVFSGKKAKFDVSVPFKPVFAALDLEEHIADATTDQYYIVKDTGIYLYDESLAELVVSEVKDSALVRIQANWLAPNGVEKVHGYLFQKNYYWTVSGLGDFKGKIRLYLTTLMDLNFSRLHKPQDFVLLYRKTPLDKWQPVDFKLIDNTIFETGFKQGEFAIALKIYE